MGGMKVGKLIDEMSAQSIVVLYGEMREYFYPNLIQPFKIKVDDMNCVTFTHHAWLDFHEDQQN